MERRAWGSSGLTTAPIGFGTWPIGGTAVKEGYGGVDDAEAIAAIRRAIDLGIDLEGAHRLLGGGIHVLPVDQQDVDIVAAEVPQALLGGGDDMVVGGVAPELPLLLRPGDAAFGDDNHVLATRAERLGQDLLGPPEPVGRRGIENDLRAAGKIRHAGVSNFSNDQLADCLRYGPVVCNQVGYNLFDRRREAETFPFCQEHGIGIMAYGPLAHGLLTGTFTRETTFGEKDWRATGKAFGLPIFERGNLLKNVAVVDELKAFAEERGHTVAQLALAWVLRHPAVSIALVGARKADEIATALPAADWDLSDDDAATIERIMAGAAGNE